MAERSRSKTRSRRPQAAPAKRIADKPSLHNLLKLRDDTAQPLYQQLEDQLTALIIDETLAAGTTLPAERQLAENLDISRATVQRSYNTLRQRKLLSAHGRLGSIVQGAGSRLHPGMDRLKGFTEEMRELGREPSSVILERKIGSDRSIASIFGLPSHARFLKLIRVRSGEAYRCRAKLPDTICRPLPGPPKGICRNRSTPICAPKACRRRIANRASRRRLQRRRNASCSVSPNPYRVC